MATVEVVPTSDITADWSISSTAPPHFDDINEGSGGPDANFISAAQVNADDNDNDLFHMSNGDIEGGVATSITVYTNGLITGGNRPEVFIKIGEFPLLVEDVLFTTSQSWKTNTLGGLSWDQDDVNNLTIGYKADVPDDKNVNQIWTCYAVITYTPAPEGYGHDFMGVPAANIDEVNGVPSANIDTIKGV